jgi:hypothetical protein
LSLSSAGWLCVARCSLEASGVCGVCALIVWVFTAWHEPFTSETGARTRTRSSRLRCSRSRSHGPCAGRPSRPLRQLAATTRRRKHRAAQARCSAPGGPQAPWRRRFALLERLGGLSSRYLCRACRTLFQRLAPVHVTLARLNGKMPCDVWGRGVREKGAKRQ